MGCRPAAPALTGPPRLADRGGSGLGSEGDGPLPRGARPHSGWGQRCAGARAGEGDGGAPLRPTVRKGNSGGTTASAGRSAQARLWCRPRQPVSLQFSA